MKIELRYSLSADDFYEFQMAYSRHHRSLTPAGQRGLRSPMTVFWVMLIGFLVVFVVASNLFTAAPAPPPPGAPTAPTLRDALLGFLPYVLVFVFIFGFMMWLRRSRYLYRRLAPQALRLGDERMAEITDLQITLRDPTSTMVASWPHFMRVIETRNTFLLFTVPRAAQIIPKRAFASEAAVSEFRQFALAHIGNQPVGFPVQLAAGAAGGGPDSR